MITTYQEILAQPKMRNVLKKGFYTCHLLDLMLCSRTVEIFSPTSCKNDFHSLFMVTSLKRDR